MKKIQVFIPYTHQNILSVIHWSDTPDSIQWLIKEKKLDIPDREIRIIDKEYGAYNVFISEFANSDYPALTNYLFE